MRVAYNRTCVTSVLQPVLRLMRPRAISKLQGGICLWNSTNFEKLLTENI